MNKEDIKKKAQESIDSIESKLSELAQKRFCKSRSQRGT